MAMHEDGVPGAAPVDIDADRVLVRPYVGDYESLDAPYETGLYADPAPVRVLQLAPRARRLAVPIAVGRHRGHRPRIRAVHRAAGRTGSRRAVLLTAGAAAVLLTLAAVMAGAGSRWAGPGSPDPEAVPAPDGRIQPADPTEPGGTTAPGGPGAGGAQPTDVPTSGPATTPGPGTLDATTPDADASTPGSGTPSRTPLPQPDGSTTGTGGTGTPAGVPDPSPVPAAYHATGPITNAAGLCLEATAGDGDRVRLWDCNGTVGQVWTLASDGTIRVAGRCMQADTGLVRLRDCTGDPAQQWRTGPGGSLVNPASARCLGDPASDATKGTPQRTAPCDQSGPQRWTLPGTG
jgi:hypothetical protein